MSTIVANSNFNFEKSTLNVSLLWKFNGHTFGEYMEFNKRCRSGMLTTEEIRFQSGFLAMTNHYVQCYITREDYNMYIKIYLEDFELPPEFTSYEFSEPRVFRQLEESQSVPSIIMTDAIKNQLITRRYFTEEDFTCDKDSSLYWFFWDASKEVDINAHQQNYYHRQQNQQNAPKRFKTYDGDTITLNLEFDYCFWNKNKNEVQISSSEDAEDIMEGESVKREASVSTREFLFSSRFSDFVIKCGDQSFPTHRMVIASKSEVFAAMLEQPLKEATDGVLTISDFKPEIVEEFLRFIYTEYANINEYATELFKMAHKYEITELKKMCENALMAQLNETTLTDINELGKMYSSEKLMDKCYSFFKLRRPTLVRTKADLEKYSDFMLRFASE